MFDFSMYRLGLVKRDLWGVGAESWFVVASTYIICIMYSQSDSKKLNSKFERQCDI